MTLKPVFPIGVGSVFGLVMACTSVPSPESPVPAPLPARRDSTAQAISLRLPQESIRYSLRQTSTVQNLEAQDSAITGNVTTTAILDFVIDPVDSIGRSSFTIMADSLQIIAEGSIPSHRAIPLTIGPVLRATVTAGRITAINALPDSLCAYSQLVTAALQLVLPQLPAQVLLPLSESVTDTVTITSCRAGSRIQLQTRRRLHASKQSPLTVGIEEEVQITGTGMLRRDSVVINGELRTTGELLFQPTSRLPTVVQTNSLGRINVRLGDSTTVFEQRSTQQIQQQP